MNRTKDTAAAKTVATYEPHGFEDLAWRIGYRLRRGLLHVFGPPQMSAQNDPHLLLAKARAARYAAR